jgi:hypothetical protein
MLTELLTFYLIEFILFVAVLLIVNLHFKLIKLQQLISN